MDAASKLLELEKSQNSAQGLAMVLQHRISTIEESLRTVATNQAGILEHVRARPAAPAAPAPNHAFRDQSLNLVRAHRALE